MAPDRFAVFGYAHIPSFKKHQRKIDESSLPDSGEAGIAQAEAIAEAVLQEGGYVRIGLDHYPPARRRSDRGREREGRFGGISKATRRTRRTR